jgi:phage-related protein
MARQITVDLISDTKAFEKSMQTATTSADKLDKKLEETSHGAGKFDAAMEKTTGGLEKSTGKFRSTADLAGGLGSVLGIQALGPISQYATGLADMADGMGGLLAPALQKGKAAFAAVNATMAANPIFLVIAAIAALVLVFVIAYKKSETFRNIVNGAFNAVKDTVVSFGHTVENVTVGAAKKIGKIADIITTPYQLAFKAIASLWNNTIGKLHVSIPGFLGFGGISFDVPDIPMLAKGGRATGGQPHIVGERGPELFVPNMSGTVIPNGALGGSQTLEVSVRPGASSDLLKMLRFELRTSGGTL